MLNARQFGLKLIANVTYGYAAAGFSGRMPMAELADAIVQVKFAPFFPNCPPVQWPCWGLVLFFRVLLLPLVYPNLNTQLNN